MSNQIVVEDKLTLRPSILRECVLTTLEARLVPLILGPPGIGKSNIIQSIADQFNLLVIDIRLSYCDPTDLNGLPALSEDRSRAGYVPMDIFPLEGDPLPSRMVNGVDTPYAGTLLFFDEITSAVPAIQAATYKIILDRKVGQYDLHPDCYIVAAGNQIGDNAIVEEMSTALQSRMVTFELGVHHGEWNDWALDNEINFRILSFMNFDPRSLHMFDPDHSDNTFPCPRTWEFASRLIKNKQTITMDDLPLLAGAISRGMARQFIQFCSIYTSLVSIKDIIADPTGVKLPDEPSTLYALTGMISSHIDDSNADQLITYLRRFPMEFQTICMKEAAKRKPELIDHPMVVELIVECAPTVF